ncbi:MAG: hypothetical protein IT276_04650 [Ignavibacteriaceae bacterium]|nr:hypothetical protein [Ignavibacteriaceae bacterium]HRN28034.1 hypothetical protein [Ignavibacteriaceae bacterium]HRQ54001.1 hypothetical protein [Ignavibacteriaceae bacterium]
MKYLLIIYCNFLLICCSNTQKINSQSDKKSNQEFSQSISRVFNNKFEEKLLKEAETFYPPRDSVVKIALKEYKDSIPEIGYWFYKTIDYIKIPYAITSDAVDYYSKKIDELYKDSTSIINSAKFIYKAEVKFYETFKLDVDRISMAIKQPYDANNVFVVEMSMEWGHSCGNLCCLGIRIKRVVVFDLQGNLLKVFYDKFGSIIIC